MTTHVLVRPDGKTYYLTLTSKQSAELKGNIVEGKTIEVKGDLFSGKNCKLESRVPLLADSEDVFFLAERSPDSFWKKVIFTNRERQKEHKPWIKNDLVALARRECGTDDVAEIFSFIDAEWENVKQHNISTLPKDHELARMIRAFFETEEGIAYAKKWHMPLPS